MISRALSVLDAYLISVFLFLIEPILWLTNFRARQSKSKARTFNEPSGFLSRELFSLYISVKLNPNARASLTCVLACTGGSLMS